MRKEGYCYENTSYPGASLDLDSVLLSVGRPHLHRQGLLAVSAAGFYSFRKATGHRKTMRW